MGLIAFPFLASGHPPFTPTLVLAALILSGILGFRIGVRLGERRGDAISDEWRYARWGCIGMFLGLAVSIPTSMLVLSIGVESDWMLLVAFGIIVGGMPLGWYVSAHLACPEDFGRPLS